MKISLLLVTLVISCLSCFAQSPVFQFTHKGSVLHLKFSNDGTRLVSYSSGNQDLALWDVQGRRLVWKRPISFIQKADEYYTLNAFAWSPDQRQIATGSANGTVQLWNAKTGEFLWTVAVAKGGVADVVFSPDGTTLAAIPYSGKENAASFITVDTGKLITTLTVSPCTQERAAFDADGKILRIAALDGNVSRWDISSGNAVTGHTPVCKSMISYGGQRSFSEDLSLSMRRTGVDSVVIEESDGKIIRNSKLNNSRLISLINSEANLAVLSEYGGFRIYDLASGKERALDNCTSGSAIDLSNDGNLFAQSCDGYQTAIKISNLKTGETSLLDGHPSTIHALSYSPDYSTLAVAGNDGNVYLLDPRNKALKNTLIGNGRRLTALAFGTDGKTLITGDEDSALHLWDISATKVIKEILVNDRSDDIDRIEISKDGSKILVLINSDAVLLDSNLSLRGHLNTPDGYSSTSGMMTYTSSSVPINSCVFDSSGANVLTGHPDGTMRIWDAASGRQIRKFKIADRILFVASHGAETALVISANERRGGFKLVNIQTGKIVAQSKPFDPSYLKKLFTSQDGRFAAVTDITGDVLVCDLKNLNVRELDNGLSGSDSVAFSRDGSTLFIGGENQNLKLFDSSTLQKLWQLLPEFVSSTKENELRAARDLRVKAITEKKKIRESQALMFAKTNRSKIYVTFDHYGDMSDPGEKRLVESSVANESKGKKVSSESNAVWLRLHNNSPLPISVPTESMYLSRDCFHTFSNGDKLFGLCRGSEIGVWFGVKDKVGKWVPYGYDFGSSVILLPNSSVVFPVPLAIWKKDFSIVFSYAFQNLRASDSDRDLNYGPEIEVKIARSDFKLKDR